MDSVLQKGDTVDFFHDEYRCPIYVKDLVSIILMLIDRWVLSGRFFLSGRCLLSDDKQMRLVLNAGGPDRLSRVQMAEVVAQVRGHDLSLIKHVSASSVMKFSLSFLQNIVEQSLVNGCELFSLTIG